MDKIHSMDKEYKDIFKITVLVFLVLLEVYVLFILNNVDLYNFSMIKQIIIRVIIQAVVNLLVFSLSYIIIYNLTKIIYTKRWIHKNKKIWIKGIWLHIHVKDEIRIGYVDFKQKFHTIEAEGYNIPPTDQGYTWRESSWSYQF